MKPIKTLSLLIFLAVYGHAQLPTFNWVFANPNIGNAYADKSAIDSSGNIVVVGTFSATVDFDPGVGTQNRTAYGHSDIFVIKLSSSGSLMWIKTFGSKGYLDYAHSICYDHDGNFIVSGNFIDTVDFDPGPGTYNVASNGNSDIFVLKLDGNGNLVWVRTMGGANDDSGQGVAVDSGNNIVLTGCISGTVDLDPSGGVALHYSDPSENDIFVSKIASAGNYLWSRDLGSAGLDIGEVIAVDNNDDIYVAGEFQDTVDFDPGTGVKILDSDSGSFFLFKMDGSSGNVLWSANFGTSGYGYVMALNTDPMGNVFVGGNFQGLADFDPGSGIDTTDASGTWAGYFCKYSSQGNYLWKSVFNSTANISLADLDVDNSGDIYATGQTNGSIVFKNGTTGQTVTVPLLSGYVVKYKNSGSLVDVALFSTSTSSLNGFILLIGGVSVNKTNGDVFTSGFYQRDTDFDPGPGTVIHTSNGDYDFYIHKMSAFKEFNGLGVEKTESNKERNAVIFPNPSSGSADLHFNSTGKEATIDLLSASGAVINSVTIKSETGFYDHRLEDKLSSGLYFVKIRSAGNQQTVKLVVEN